MVYYIAMLTSDMGCVLDLFKEYEDAEEWLVKIASKDLNYEFKDFIELLEMECDQAFVDEHQAYAIDIAPRVPREKK